MLMQKIALNNSKAGDMVSRSIRKLVAIVLIISWILLSGCSQIVSEGIREGKLIDSKIECKQCVISGETKMEFDNSGVPNKIKVFKEVTYGDTVKNKYEAEGYKVIGKPPVGSTVFTKIISIPISLGLVLLFPQYYTEPVTKCVWGANSSCDYTTETWLVENEYQYSTTYIDTVTKKVESREPVTVSIYENEPTSKMGTSQVAKPRKLARKLVKKEKKVKQDKITSGNDTARNNIPPTNKNYADPVATQIIYPKDDIAEVDLCVLRAGSTSSEEYKISYDNGEKKLESTFKFADLNNLCPEVLPAKVDNDFVEMPPPPE
jgi:hypothetical protein